ncbi:hypothetical protein D3C72_2587280 [compost metagenome]
MMIAVPAALLVQRDEEEVRALKIFKDILSRRLPRGISPGFSAKYGITQRAA